MLLRVLHVEDNPGDQALVRMALARSGLAHELCTAPDEGTAQRWLGEQAPPHLLLVDINLGAGSGLHVLSDLTAGRGTDILSAVLSSSQAPSDVLSARTAGAHYYCVKPASFPELARVCEWLMRTRDGQDADPLHAPGVTQLMARPDWKSA